MKLRKSIVAAILALAFAATAYTGCGGKKKQYETDELGKFYRDADGNRVYELIMYDHGTTLMDSYPLRDQVMAEINRRLLEEFGYKVDINVYSYADDMFETKITTDIAGGKVIDLVRINSREILVNYVNQELLTDLTGRISGLTNMDEWLRGRNADIWLETSVDGMIFGIPAADYPCYRGNFVRGDYLKKAGYVNGDGSPRPPSAFAELEDFLLKAKGNDDQGKPVMSGRRTVSWSVALKEIEGQLLGRFTDTPGDFLNAEGKIMPKQFDPGYKEFIRKLNDWYRAGYVDDSLFNATYDSSAAMLRDGNTAVSGSNIWALEYSTLRAVNAANPSMEIKFMGYMDDDMLSYQSSGYATEIYVIPYTSVNYKVMLQFMDWAMYDKDNYNLLYNGIENVTYVTKNNLIDVPDAYKNKYSQPHELIGRFMLGGNAVFSAEFQSVSTPAQAALAYSYALAIPDEKIYVPPTTYTNTKLPDLVQLKKATADKALNEDIQAIIKGGAAGLDAAYDAMLAKFTTNGGLEAYEHYSGIYKTLTFKT